MSQQSHSLLVLAPTWLLLQDVNIIVNESQMFIPTSNTSYVLLEIFMQFATVKAEIWWNNGRSSFTETRCKL